MPKKIPPFKNEKEEAEYWDRQSFVDHLAESEPDDLEMSQELRASIEARSTLKRVTLRLSDDQILAAKRIAQSKGIPYQTLIRMWVVEAIRKEG
ncbi:MAG: CopG family antitoxin [Bacillota bacterium]|jgi:predicted DNA binding CopG/RHH family protein